MTSTRGGVAGHPDRLALPEMLTVDLIEVDGDFLTFTNFVLLAAVDDDRVHE